MSFLVAIPLYNHGGSIEKVLEGLRTLALNPSVPVLVLDDGSTDGGGELARMWGEKQDFLTVHVLRHPRNLGKGTAIQSAAAWADEHGFTHMLTMDADGQHMPEDVPRLLEAARADPGAIIVGSRDFSSKEVPLGSRFGRSFSGFWMRVQTGRRVDDMQSGFRLYPVAVIRSLRCVEKRFSFEMEVLVKAAWSGIPIVNLPVGVYYPPRHLRVSHFRKVHDNMLITLMNTRLTVRALLPLPFLQRDVADEGARVSVLHPVASLRKLLADDGTPFMLALSTFIPIYINFLPLVGLQSILTLLAIGWLKLSRTWTLALHYAVWPPLLIPFCIQGGYFLRNGKFLTEISWETLGGQAGSRLFEWLVGSVVFGFLASLVCALAVYALSLYVRAIMRRGAE